MFPVSHVLSDKSELIVREADIEDAAAILDYLHLVSGESDNLTFGVGEFDVTLTKERETIARYRTADNELFILAFVGGQIVSILNLASSQRPRLRHVGTLGITVRKSFWGMGIGSLMMNHLIAWCDATKKINKINLRVRTDNYVAIRLYERHNFQVEGTMRNEMWLDEKFYDIYTMGLILPA